MIALTTIFFIKILKIFFFPANSSHKYRPISNVLENTSTGVLRDILIKCKNFMTKLFFFSQPDKDYTDIYNFITKLIYHSNSERVIRDRFKFLIQEVNAKFLHNNIHRSVSQTISQDLAQTGQQDNQAKKQIRKSYLIPIDLQEDLIQCECDGFMQVKSGFAVVTQDRFKINT